MNRIFTHYTLWEDYQAGLYQGAVEDGLVAAAAEVLSSSEELADAMRYVATNWRHAAEFNLSNTGRNRKAWLGQAACCWAVGANEATTKAAWWTLTVEQQSEANAVAHDVIEEWERNFGLRLFHHA